MDQKLRTFLSRIGGKTRIRKTIYEIMPEDFTYYIEPYLGGGAIFLGYKFKKDQKIILNDLCPTLISAWRLMKTSPDGVIDEYNSRDLDYLKSIYYKETKDDLHKLVKYILLHNNTFGAKANPKGLLYRGINPWPKLKLMDKYKKKLEGVEIQNRDAIEIIKENNYPNAFLYVDPPYETSDKLYKFDRTNFEILRDTLKDFKGKFLLSINDSENIRELFKEYNFTELTDGGIGNKAIGVNKRKELLIKNF